MLSLYIAAAEKLSRHGEAMSAGELFCECNGRA